MGIGFDIKTNDGKVYRVPHSNIIEIKDYDASILQFFAKEKYKVAKYDVKKVEELAKNDIIYIYIYTTKMTSGGVAKANFKSFLYESNEEYNFHYSVDQKSRIYFEQGKNGISGSPILDSCGYLRGIHVGSFFDTGYGVLTDEIQGCE